MKKLLLLFLLCRGIDAFPQFAIVMGDSLQLRTEMHATYAADSSRCDVYLVVETGMLNDRQYPNYVFDFVNRSNDPLIIEQAGWGEPLFAPDYPKEPIAKGKYAHVRYRCVAEQRPGPFSKSATIQTNKGTVVITFKGFILPAQFRASRLSETRRATVGKPVYTEFSISNKTDAPLTIGNLQADLQTTISADTSACGETIEPHSSRLFHLVFTPASTGRVVSKASLLVDGRRVEYTIFALVSEPTGKKKRKAH